MREWITNDLWVAVIERDGPVCHYCRRAARPLHIDHVIPVSKGGQNVLTNLVVASRSCNLNKAAQVGSTEHG